MHGPPQLFNPPGGPSYILQYLDALFMALNELHVDIHVRNEG